MSQARTLWEEGRERGHQVVALGLAVALTVAALDLARADRVTTLFDVFFVVVCVALALLVRPQDFFTVGVLPPLIMASVMVLVGLRRPAAIAHPDDGLVQGLLELLGEPLLSSTLILPGETEPRTMGWDVKEELDHVVDIVVEAGETPAVPTTVVDWSDGPPEVTRVGAGDPARFGTYT